MAKCAASTSGTLGVRLCGMQVYQADIEHYMKRDKYYGRELNEEGFKKTLYNFFHNGFRLRTKVVRKVVQKLDQLRRVIERQSSYRFYSWYVLAVAHSFSPVKWDFLLSHLPFIEHFAFISNFNFVFNQLRCINLMTFICDLQFIANCVRGLRKCKRELFAG